MDFRELSYVCALKEVSSISKAALRVGISQPSMSKFLIGYEEKLGFRLFNKLGKRLVPTYEGGLFIEKATELLRLGSQLQSMVDDLNDRAGGSVTIGVTPARGRYILPNILPLFREKFPAYKINILEGSATEMERFLEEGLVDVALFLAGEQEYPHLILEEISKEEVLLCISQDSPYATQGVWRKGFAYPWIDLSKFKNELFILQLGSARLTPMVEKLFEEYHLHPETLRTSNIDGNISLAAQGMGVTFATELSVRFCNPMRKPVYLSVGSHKLYNRFAAVYHRDMYLSDAAKELILITKQIFSS